MANKSWKVEYRRKNLNGVWLVLWITAPDREEARNKGYDRIAELNLGKREDWVAGFAKEQL